MPKLKCSIDGNYYTHAFVGHGRPPATYQVSREGATHLANKGIHEGDDIPRDLFNELKEDELLFTGGSGLGEDISGFEPEDGFTNPLTVLEKVQIQILEAARKKEISEIKAEIDLILTKIISGSLKNNVEEKKIIRNQIKALTSKKSEILSDNIYRTQLLLRLSELTRMYLLSSQGSKLFQLFLSVQHVNFQTMIKETIKAFS